MCCGTQERGVSGLGLGQPGAPPVLRGLGPWLSDNRHLHDLVGAP
jgi:hypothetical protein